MHVVYAPAAQPVGRSFAAASRTASATAPFVPAGTGVTPPSADRIVTSVSSRAEDLAGRDVVDDQQVAALAGQLRDRRARGRRRPRPRSRRRSRRRPGPAAGARPRARRGCPGCARGVTTGRRVVVVRLLDLVLGRLGGPEVGDRGGHHDDVGVGRGRQHRRPQLQRRPHAGRRAPRPAAAPPAAPPRASPGRRGPRAAAASATPCRPDDRLPRNRTGSSGSRVPPAETTTCRPARSARRLAGTAGQQPGRAPRRSARAPAAGPGPVSAPVSRPAVGVEHDARRASAASPRSPGSRRAPTSRCASPARAAPGTGR